MGFGGLVCSSQGHVRTWLAPFVPRPNKYLFSLRVEFHLKGGMATGSSGGFEINSREGCAVERDRESVGVLSHPETDSRQSTINPLSSKEETTLWVLMTFT